MLEITVPKQEFWDEATSQFLYSGDTVKLQLEHSLVSLAKWESRWQKPFLKKTNKTDEEILDYIRCMAINPAIEQEVFDRLTNENLKDIQAYIDAPMTATTFSDSGSGSTNRETITAEIIYNAMIAFNIPMECQHWHLNRLITLIRVCSIKNQKQEVMPMREVMSENQRLNEERRRKYNSRG